MLAKDLADSSAIPYLVMLKTALPINKKYEKMDRNQKGLATLVDASV
jgi:hypothetical protein